MDPQNVLCQPPVISIALYALSCMSSAWHTQASLVSSRQLSKSKKLQRSALGETALPRRFRASLIIRFAFAL